MTKVIMQIVRLLYTFYRLTKKSDYAAFVQKNSPLPPEIITLCSGSPE